MAEQSAESKVFTLDLTSECEIFEEDQDRFTAEYTERQDGIGDITITVNDELTAAHRDVLTQKSSYFKAMLLGRFSERGATSLDMSRTFDDAETLNDVLDYMYTGTISLTDENIASVVNIASILLLSELLLACSEYLLANIAPCTCIAIFSLADRYSLQRVREGCLEVIKAWFPFYLDQSQPALEMSPDCLKALINENVFDLVADDVVDTFLQNWHQHFKSTATKAMKLPKEVKNLIKRKHKGASVKGSEEKADEKEEVLLALLLPVGSDRRYYHNPDLNRNCIEIMAFSPKRKSWKMILHHEFSDLIGPNGIEEMIGVSENEAFFLFRTKGFDIDYRINRFIASVDLVSNVECLIELPNGLFKPVDSFLCLWGSSLCGFFCEEDRAVWSLYKNEHAIRCPETCTGDCWEAKCQLPQCRIGTSDPAHGCDIFNTKVYANKLYVCADYQEEFKIEFFRVSQNLQEDESWEIVQLPSPVDTDDFDFELCQVSYIFVERETSLLKFVFKLNADDNPIDMLMGTQQASHEEYTYTYDVANSKWKGEQFRKVVYPKDVALPLQITRKVRDYEESQDDCPTFTSNFDLDACLQCYYARSTSPYNTLIWKVLPNPNGKEWELLTRAPGPIDAFYSMEYTEMRSGFLQALPNATFKDFSGVIGQSAVTNMGVKEPKTDFEMEFNEDLLSYSAYQFTWAKLWEGKELGEFSYKSPEGSSESDFQDSAPSEENEESSEETSPSEKNSEESSDESFDDDCALS